MNVLIRFLLALLIAVGFMDLNGFQPMLFTNLITTWGNYAYLGASLAIAWLVMPAVSFYFDA